MTSTNDFDSFANRAWSEHAERPAEVADELSGALALIAESAHIPRFAQLAAHVCGEHLGQWPRGIALIERLREHPCYAPAGEAEDSIVRTSTALRLAALDDPALISALTASERVRVLCLTSSALLGRGELARAATYFEQACALIDTLPPQDLAHRALAVTGNNMAAELEGKAERDAHETELMLTAARTARRHWELAGTWLNVERAEYRLAKSLLAAAVPDQALEHARACLDVCRANGAEPSELFWALECLALCQHALATGEEFDATLAEARAAFEALSEAEQSGRRATFERLEALPAISPTAN